MEEGGVLRLERRGYGGQISNGEKVAMGGGTMTQGRACPKCEEIYKLSRRLKFPTSQQY